MSVEMVCLGLLGKIGIGEGVMAGAEEGDSAFEKVSLKERKRRVVQGVMVAQKNRAEPMTREEVEELVERKLAQEIPESRVVGGALERFLVAVCRYHESQRAYPAFAVVPSVMREQIRSILAACGGAGPDRDRVAGVRLIVGELENGSIRVGR